MTSIFNYIDRQSPVHRLTGATKLICLIFWTFAAMSSYDTRFLALLTVLSVFLFTLSRLRLRDVSFMIGFTVVFMLLNNILIFIFSPEHGVAIYGTRHVLFTITGRYVVTREQLFFHLNLMLKYFATIPFVLLFVSTTNPSEFAASLNRVGVNYKIAYAVALALRYIPDIQHEYRDISLSLQARGVELSRKESIIKRLKSAATVLIPLILSSLDRIEIISNAMELRSFGKHKKRTWYMGYPFTRSDFLAIIISLLLLLVSFFLTAVNKGRFYNPFA